MQTNVNTLLIVIALFFSACDQPKDSASKEVTVPQPEPEPKRITCSVTVKDSSDLALRTEQIHAWIDTIQANLEQLEYSKESQPGRTSVVDAIDMDKGGYTPTAMITQEQVDFEWFHSGKDLVMVRSHYKSDDYKAGGVNYVHEWLRFTIYYGDDELLYIEGMAVERGETDTIFSNRYFVENEYVDIYEPPRGMRRKPAGDFIYGDEEGELLSFLYSYNYARLKSYGW